ncbi:hypothetical protein AALO_G00159310 [Alosa alosa]|uniref:Uncharacterized protein n=1 Tax=Alosa alosa TaxID=278164 RepID=A0AAV6GJD5_9TELE|nr:hypothetical protein AALO_G00159310 [Alosa alosa]
MARQLQQLASARTFAYDYCLEYQYCIDYAFSVAGLKKQFHEACQLLNEKMKGAEGTTLDEDVNTFKFN